MLANYFRVDVVLSKPPPLISVPKALNLTDTPFKLNPSKEQAPLGLASTLPNSRI